MKSGRRNEYDYNGSDRSEPNVFILLVWFGVAGFAVLFAMVALFYGVPDRNRQPVAMGIPSSGIDSLTTGSLNGNIPPRPTTITPGGGRSDIAGTMTTGGMPSDADSEIARLKVENVALRQALDQMRSQMDLMSERVEKIETRIGDVTGSVTPDENTTSGEAYNQLADELSPNAPEAQTAAQIPTNTVARTQFGVELGTFADLGAVKQAWRSMLRDHANLFEGLDALATVRDRNGRTELLLVAGPFKNAADAAEHCGKAEAAGLQCLPAFYLGQPLEIR
ncbi:hypothetical protein [Oryzibacter oryziterrae]|uniref:hypothetical protein n=1 Tax=Oryzibacter oryziterrae TaxID=2766474 RepID=UPI001F3CBA7E|nr:hypothetical protein [Oryzibacter oryziterrae]